MSLKYGEIFMKLSETADFLYSRPISFSYFSATSPPSLSLFRNFLCPFFYTFLLREHAIKIYDVVPYDAFNSPYRIESNPRRARMGTHSDPPPYPSSRNRVVGNRRSFFLSSVFLYNHYVLLTSLARTEFPSIIKSISKPGTYLARNARDEILL